MSFSLPDSVVKHHDLQRALEQLNESLSRNETIDQVVASSPVINELVATNPDYNSTEMLRELRDHVQSILDASPLFDIILAATPHDTFLIEITRWFRNRIHPTALLRVNVRRAIGGGIVVRSKNRIFDFSLRPQILANSSKVAEVVRRV